MPLLAPLKPVTWSPALKLGMLALRGCTTSLHAQAIDPSRSKPNRRNRSASSLLPCLIKRSASCTGTALSPASARACSAWAAASNPRARPAARPAAWRHTRRRRRPGSQPVQVPAPGQQPGQPRSGARVAAWHERLRKLTSRDPGRQPRIRRLVSQSHASHHGKVRPCDPRHPSPATVLQHPNQHRWPDYTIWPLLASALATPVFGS